jgi:hypothetical protein
MKKADRGAFKPTNASLVRQGVKCDSKRALIAQESVVEGVALVLTLRAVLPKALLRWLVERFVLRKVEKLRLVYVPHEGLPFEFQISSLATCEDLARHFHLQRWSSSLPLDTFWIHVRNGTGVPALELFYIGSRRNECLADNWAYLGQWTDPVLTEEELDWLNLRTLVEAGFSHGSVVDARYHYHIGAVVTGSIIRLPCLPGEDDFDLFGVEDDSD